MPENFPTFRGLGFDAVTEARLSNELMRLCRVAGVSPHSLEASDLALRVYAHQRSRRSTLSLRSAMPATSAHHAAC